VSVFSFKLFFLNNGGKQQTKATERINGQQMKICAQFISLRMYYKRGKYGFT